MLARQSVDGQRLLDIVLDPLAQLGILALPLLQPAGEVLARLANLPAVVEPAQLLQPVADMCSKRAQALNPRQPAAPRQRNPVGGTGLVFTPGQRVATQLPANRGSRPTHQAANLAESFPGFMKPGKLVTLINIELIILSSHCNSGQYRCCNGNENLALFAELSVHDRHFFGAAHTMKPTPPPSTTRSSPTGATMKAGRRPAVPRPTARPTAFTRRRSPNTRRRRWTPQSVRNWPPSSPAARKKAAP